MTLVGFITEFGENWKYHLYRTEEDVDELFMEYSDGCSLLDYARDSDRWVDSTYTRKLGNMHYVFNAEGWE